MASINQPLLCSYDKVVVRSMLYNSVLTEMDHCLNSTQSTVGSWPGLQLMKMWQHNSSSLLIAIQRQPVHPRSIENIHVATCTIDSDGGADENRMLSLSA